MKKSVLGKRIVLGVATVFLSGATSAFAQSGEVPAGAEKYPVLREALNVQGSIVAVDISLLGEDLLESKVTGFMERARPRIRNVLVVGPGAGRLGPTTRDQVLADLEEDPPYPTRRAGLLDLRSGSEAVADGTLTRMRFRHELPVEKMREQIKRRKKINYEFWVYMESSQRGGRYRKYKFELERLPGLLLAGAESEKSEGGAP